MYGDVTWVYFRILVAVNQHSWQIVQLRYECRLPYENNKNIYVCPKLAFYAYLTFTSMGTLRLRIGAYYGYGWYIGHFVPTEGSEKMTAYIWQDDSECL